MAALLGLMRMSTGKFRNQRLAGLALWVLATLWPSLGAAAPEVQTQIPSLLAAAQAEMSKSGFDPGKLAQELVTSIEPPDAQQLQAMAQFGEFLAEVPGLNFSNKARVEAVATMGARAGQCLLLRFGVPQGLKVTQLMASSITSSELSARYQRIQQTIRHMGGVIDVQRPCDRRQP